MWNATWTDALLAYAHYAAIIALFAFLAQELVLLRAPAALDVNRVAKIDAAFGAAAAAVLVTGLGRLLLGAKPVAFYLHNPVFHAKVGLFLLAGVVSIAPTLTFLRWRRQAKADPAFRPADADIARARRLLIVQLHLLVVVPLLATLMARAIGYQA